VKKWLIRLHRYLATVLWAPVAVWFASGIAMAYVGGMPRLTESDRLRGLEPIAVGSIHLSPIDAAARRRALDSFERVSVLTIMGRPAYRFDGSPPDTVFADTGELLAPVDTAAALRIASSFVGLPAARFHPIATLDAADQWTLGLAGDLPWHRIGIDDAQGTEVYVSARLGEVMLITSHRSRALAWISAVPHWVYLRALRQREQLWRQVVLWTSGLAALAALAGLMVGIAQYRARYIRLTRWHYRAGVLFGPVALTWRVSGWLSMQPWHWARESDLYPRITAALSGRTDLKSFPAFDAGRWSAAGAVKQIDLVSIGGEPYYIVRRPAAAPLVVAARTFAVRAAPFATDAIVERITAALPEVPLAASQRLSDYDAYYYDRRRELPLPVARLESKRGQSV